MRVGILTFHDADNYGALLQAYALQQTLKKLGMENEFVAIEREQKKTLSPSNGPMAVFMKRVAEAGEKRKQLFELFRTDCLEISPLYRREEAELLNNRYQWFLVGSDQVWNFKIPDVDPRYFLPFAAKEKKYSYAASFGSSELPEKVAPWCSEQLKTFQRISVREESGRNLVKTLTGMDAKVHADPTLLLERTDWEEISEEREGNYVLLFLLVYDEQAVRRAKEIASEKSLELKTVTAAFLPQLGIEAWCNTGVQEWITLVRNAQFVITNSFHGMVFSILFEREFEVIPLKGELSARNGRIEELLNKTGLAASRDYVKAKQVIEQMRKEAFSYLVEVGKENGIVQ